MISGKNRNEISCVAPGADRFGPVFAALRRAGYGGWCAVEPFEYVPDGPGAAARAIGYLRGVEEGAGA